jgi:hypothetical protein
MRILSLLSIALFSVFISCKKEKNQEKSAPKVATITTNAVSGVTVSSVTSGGNITSDGGAPITARGVVWSTEPNPTVELTTRTADGEGSGSFTSVIANLNSSTKYYIRAYATNSVGTSYGNEISFTTTTDIRDKFVGIWDGIYKFEFPNLPPNLPFSIPDSIPMTIEITKNTISPSEITITFQGGGMFQLPQATAVVTNNEYIYKPITLNNNGIELILNGSGKVSSDGKVITESGTQTGSATIPGIPLPLNLNGKWSSVLKKQ